MLLDVAVVYQAYGKIRNSRFSSTVGFAEVIPFDVAVLDGSDAPVVAEWDDSRPPHQKRRDPQEVYLGHEHVRYAEQSYWRPLRKFDAIEVKAGTGHQPVDLALLSDILRQSRFHPSTRWQNPNTSKKKRPGDHFETVAKTSRNHAIRDIASSLSRLRIIDGMPYVKCGRPIIRVDYEEFSTGLSGKVANMHGEMVPRMTGWLNNAIRIVTADRDHKLHLRHNVYTIQDFRTALKKSRMLNAHGHYDVNGINEFNAGRAPVLYDHPAIQDPDADLCALFVERFVAKVEENREGLLPKGDYTRLRLFCEIVAALERLPDPDGFEALEIAGREYLERYEDYEQHIHQEQVLLRSAIEIAENRPVHVHADQAGVRHGL